jgi:hypothetical protein
VLAHQGQIEGIEVEYEVPMTGPQTMTIHGQRLAGSAAGDTLILLEIEDVTEREAEERHRRQLMMTAVHELRNPLTAIKGYAQVIQKRQATSERALCTILEQVQQLSHLIDDLQASAGSGIVQAHFEPQSSISRSGTSRRFVGTSRTLSKPWRRAPSYSQSPPSNGDRRVPYLAPPSQQGGDYCLADALPSDPRLAILRIT